MVMSTSWYWCGRGQHLVSPDWDGSHPSCPSHGGEVVPAGVVAGMRDHIQALEVEVARLAKDRGTQEGQTELPSEALSVLKDRAFDLVDEELSRALAKSQSWPNDPIHGATVVGEEAEKLLRATIQARYEGGSPDDVQEAAVQTAVTAIRFIVASLSASSQKGGRE